MSSGRQNSDLGRAWHSHIAGRDDSAVTEFEKLVEQSPEDKDVLYGLGLAYRGANQAAQAVEVFTKLQDLLAAEEAENEDEFNRLEMLRRMVKQQLEIVQGMQ